MVVAVLPPPSPLLGSTSLLGKGLVLEALEVGLGGMTVLRYTRVFRNTDGMIFNTVKNTDAFLSISVASHNKTERRKLID